MFAGLPPAVLRERVIAVDKIFLPLDTAQ